MKRDEWSKAWLSACRRKPDEALALLAAAAGDPVRAVHGLRRLAKDWRALLRLAPPALAREAASLRRDVGEIRRSLADLRRGHMVPRMLARAARGLEDVARPGLAAADADAHTPPIDAARRASLEAQIAALGERQAGWRLGPAARETVPRALREGVIRSYRRGKRHMRHDVEALPLAKLHDLRTATTDLRYQLAFLAPLWPGPIAALVEEAERLRDRIGRIVDLTEARATLGKDDDPRLHEALDREEARRRKQAARLAACFYADSPGALARRLSAWFDA